MYFLILNTVTTKLERKHNDFRLIIRLKLFCVFRMPNTNATRKAERRAKLAAAKAARNAAGLNMFNPTAHLALVNINSSPLGGTKENPLPTMALHNNVNLRAPGLFTGKPYQGYLNPEVVKRIELLGLPVKSHEYLTEEERAAVNAIAAENAATAQASKSASGRNWWGVTGAQYVFPKSANSSQARNRHFHAILARTQQASEELRKLQDAAEMRSMQGDYESADQLLKRAAEIRAEQAYTVAEPTEKSLQNAEAYHMFAKEIEGKQGRTGLFSSCFGGSCSVNQSATVGPSTTANPLHTRGSRRGGRSRRKQKHQNKRTRKH